MEDIVYYLLRNIPPDKLKDVPEKASGLLHSIVTVAMLQADVKKPSYALFEQQFTERFFPVSR